MGGMHKEKLWMSKDIPRTRTMLAGLLIGAFALTLATCGRAEITHNEAPDELLKWPLRDTRHFITVRIPGGYRYMGGKATMSELAPNYPVPNGKRGDTYTETLFAEALWPDMAARTQQNQDEFVSPLGERHLRIVVGAIIDWPDRRVLEMDALDRGLAFDASQYATREEKMMERYFHVARITSEGANESRIEHHFPLDPAPREFGLERAGMGPVKNSTLPKPRGAPNDVYFLRDNRGHLLTFAKCSSEHHDYEADPASNRPPHCVQNFFYAPLNGIVEVRYHRKHLGEWREIQIKTEELLHTFLQQPR